VQPSISADGRYITFESSASNLVSGDTNNAEDVFVGGSYNFIQNVSVSSGWWQSNDASVHPSISANGRYIAFESSASNLVSGDTNNAEDIFVRDTFRGTTIRASVSSTGADGNGKNSSPSISADGRYVAFYSDASDLAPGDTNGTDDVFVRDTAARTTTRVSVNSSGGEGNTTPCVPSPPTPSVNIRDCSFRHRVSISADGRYVAFVSLASLDPLDPNSLPDVYIHDLSTGKTALVSVSAQGTAPVDGLSDSPAISADGRYVTFSSRASNLVPNDTNGNSDVFIRDIVAGITTRASLSSSGGEGNNYSDLPSISADGRYVAFDSLASNLITGDTNDHSDIFVRDLTNGVTSRMSVSTTGKEGNADSFESSLSADGRYMAFGSDASNLVANDTNGKTDIFVRDLISGVTRRVSEWTIFYPWIID
jgi:Tol biopolymer transport system component